MARIFTAGAFLPPQPLPHQHWINLNYRVDIDEPATLYQAPQPFEKAASRSDDTTTANEPATQASQDLSREILVERLQEYNPELPSTMIELEWRLPEYDPELPSTMIDLDWTLPIQPEGGWPSIAKVGQSYTDLNGESSDWHIEDPQLGTRSGIADLWPFYHLRRPRAEAWSPAFQADNAVPPSAAFSHEVSIVGAACPQDDSVIRKEQTRASKFRSTFLSRWHLIVSPRWWRGGVRAAV
ncbi:hypothetical protein LTR10_015748 [Elasticomyces elasticus]|nr:hypothetical protein LTR10_015748 [Elasticomyces elasticus]KAK4975423.1 hypothetical protein LTR42_004633 [Elasticomyces elasticus]